MLIDTHCHIHDSEFYTQDTSREAAYSASRNADVAMICVGTNVQSSQEAIDFCATHAACYPIVGVHPHDSEGADIDAIRRMVEAHRQSIVGIGEIGLDYFYTHSSPEVQQAALRAQLRIAVDYNLPVSFHVRDAFDDFWPIFDEFTGIRGVLHSFTDTQENLDQAIKRGLLIGVNGISTFTKQPEQQALFRDIAVENIVLETDAPFLTPVPFRGKVNLPAYVEHIAVHQAGLKAVTPDEIMRVTTTNAKRIFGIQ